MRQVQKTKLEKQRGPKHGVEGESPLTPVTGPDPQGSALVHFLPLVSKKVFHFPKFP